MCRPPESPKLNIDIMSTATIQRSTARATRIFRLLLDCLYEENPRLKERIEDLALDYHLEQAWECEKFQEKVLEMILLDLGSGAFEFLFEDIRNGIREGARDES